MMRRTCNVQLRFGAPKVQLLPNEPRCSTKTWPLSHSYAYDAYDALPTKLIKTPWGMTQDDTTSLAFHC